MSKDKDHIKAVEAKEEERIEVPAPVLKAKDAYIAQLEAAVASLNQSAAVYKRLAEYQEADLEGKAAQLVALSERLNKLERHGHSH